MEFHASRLTTKKGCSIDRLEKMFKELNMEVMRLNSLLKVWMVTNDFLASDIQQIFASKTVGSTRLDIEQSSIARIMRPCYIYLEPQSKSSIILIAFDSSPLRSMKAVLENILRPVKLTDLGPFIEANSLFDRQIARGVQFWQESFGYEATLGFSPVRSISEFLAGRVVQILSFSIQEFTIEPAELGIWSMHFDLQDNSIIISSKKESTEVEETYLPEAFRLVSTIFNGDKIIN